MASDIQCSLLPLSPPPPPPPPLTTDDSRHTSDELPSTHTASKDTDDDRLVASVSSSPGNQSESPRFGTNPNGTSKDVTPEAPAVIPATSTTSTSQATTPSPTRRIYNFLCSAITGMARVRKRGQDKSTKVKQAKKDPDYDPSKEDHREEEEEYRYGANLMKIEAEHLGKYLHETISGPRRGKKSLELQIPVKIEEQDEGVTYPTPPAERNTLLSVQTTVSKRPLDSDAISPIIKRLKLEESHESILSSVQDTPAPELRFDYRHNALAESAAGHLSTPTTNTSRAGSPLRTQSTPGSLSPELSPGGDGVDVAMDDAPLSPSVSPVARVGSVVDEEQSPNMNPGSLGDSIVNYQRPKPSRKPSRSRRQSHGKSQGKSRKRTYSPTADNRFDSPSDSENDESLDEFEMHRIRPNEKTGIVFDFSSERAARWATAINLPEGLYNHEEQDLFFRLAMRGFEPLVPQLWRHDFPTLPESLYPPISGPSFKPLFQVRRSSNLYATKALANLFNVGGRVRDCDILGQRPEKVIKAAIKQYFRWALFDADLHTTEDSIPVYAIYAQKEGETTLQAVQRLNRRLRYLTSKYHEALGMTQGPTQAEEPVQTAGSMQTENPVQIEETEHQEQIHDSIETPRSFPLLMGFIICGPIVAIVTHSTDPQEAEASFDGKFISQFDLSERGQDVWNSLAIAIAVMHTRRTMIRLAEQGLGGFTFYDTAQPASDRDL